MENTINGVVRRLVVDVCRLEGGTTRAATQPPMVRLNEGATVILLI
jgi:hypothetical protein